MENRLSIWSGNPSAFSVTVRPSTPTVRPVTVTGVYGFTRSSSTAIVEFSHRSRDSRHGSSSP